MRDTVIVFARLPRLGGIKRRLARGLGERATLQFYSSNLWRLLMALRRDRRFRTLVAVAGRGAWDWPVAHFPQGRGDIGMRMTQAFRRFPNGRVTLIGSDIPDVNARHLGLAFAGLGSADAVFGPAADGGYWLVAMGPRRPAHPFANARWSTQHALSDTRRNFTGRKVALLETLHDIDTMEDWQAWRRRVGTS